MSSACPPCCHALCCSNVSAWRRRGPDRRQTPSVVLRRCRQHLRMSRDTCQSCGAVSPALDTLAGRDSYLTVPLDRTWSRIIGSRSRCTKSLSYKFSFSTLTSYSLSLTTYGPTWVNTFSQHLDFPLTVLVPYLSVTLRVSQPVECLARMTSMQCQLCQLDL